MSLLYGATTDLRRVLPYDESRFIFAEGPVTPPGPRVVTDTFALDTIRGTAAEEVFAFRDDGLRDVLDPKSAK